MLYTRKGDDGTTSTLCSGERISKGSLTAQGLGVVDELNSYLGICKVKAEKSGFTAGEENTPFCCIVHEVQSNLFIVQSELACSGKTITIEKIKKLEKLVNEIEDEMTPITTFTVSGGTELSTYFDYARALTRRAERIVVELNNVKEREIGEHTLAYMNRLSSLLFALARLANTKSGIKEESPTYE